MTSAPAKPLRIWCNQSYPEPVARLLREGLREHELHFATGPSADLAHADVAFGQPDADACATLPRLRWVHVSTAGYTSFDRGPVRDAFALRGATLTTSSSVYSEPCAQHALALMLAESRQLPRSMRQQLTDRVFDMRPTRAASFLLTGQTVLMVGFGAIARRLCEVLAPFNVEILGWRRRPRGDEPVPMVAPDDLDRALGRAHHVIDILPANAETARFFDRKRLLAMRPGAVFYNIGRGTTVDQDALGDALKSGHLRAAYLDVVDPEPLPPAHPLWTLPNCTITPHAAGGHANEQQRLVEHFLENVRRYSTGAPLLDRIV